MNVSVMDTIRDEIGTKTPCTNTRMVFCVCVSMRGREGIERGRERIERESDEVEGRKKARKR